VVEESPLEVCVPPFAPWVQALVLEPPDEAVAVGFELVTVLVLEPELLLPATKGLASDPPFALELKLKVPYVFVCCVIVSERLSEFNSLPDLAAKMKPNEEAVRSIEPPLHELQLEHLKFAVICPFDTPEPSRRVTWAFEL